MPIISDRVYMTESAYMVIAGAALIKGAKSAKISSLDIGGPEVHVHQSGCADVRVPDDETLLACLRRDIARLPSSAAPFYRGDGAAIAPRFRPQELAGIVPTDHREAYDANEVMSGVTEVLASLDHQTLAQLQPGSYQVLLGNELARQLGVSPGGQVTLVAPGGQVTPVGVVPRLKQLRVAGVIDTGHYEYDATLALLHIDDAERIFRLEGPNGIRVKLRDAQQAPAVAAELMPDASA